MQVLLNLPQIVYTPLYEAQITNKILIFPFLPTLLRSCSYVPTTPV